MGCWDIMCILCGNTTHPILRGSADDDLYNQILKMTEWMNYCTIMTADGNVYHNLREISCNVTFRYNNFDLTTLPIGYDTFTSPIATKGIFIHTDCWNYVKDITGHKLSHKYIYDKDVDYGKIKGYLYQDFDFVRCYKENKWMLQTPLNKDPKNTSRINKIMSQLKITKSELNKREDRPSPNLSASMVPNNTTMLGNDGIIWIKKGDKWVHYDADIKIMTIQFTLPKINNSFKFGLKKRNLVYKEEIGEKDSVFILEIIGKTTTKYITYKLIGPAKAIIKLLEFTKRNGIIGKSK